MCRLPVTFGGGIGTTKVPLALGLPSWPMAGLNMPSFSHQSYQAVSTAAGLYAVAMGAERSRRAELRLQRRPREWACSDQDLPFLSPLGVVLTKGASSGSLTFSFLALGGPAGALVTCLTAERAAFSASLAAFFTAERKNQPV